jgi:hypothetical protein
MGARRFRPVCLERVGFYGRHWVSPTELPGQTAAWRRSNVTAEELNWWPMRRSGMAAMAWLLVGCGSAEPRSLKTLQQYQVRVEIIDELAERELRFEPGRDHVDRPDQCGSLAGAAVRFAGMPLTMFKEGGWTKERVPTNNAPGETINLDHCEAPFIDLRFGVPKGEQQNGTLVIDGEGLHFAVPVNHPFGNPDVSLISATVDKVELAVEGFLAPPSLDAISVIFSPITPHPTRVQVEKVALVDGKLALSLPPDARDQGGIDAVLMVRVGQGSEPLPCIGFVACDASSEMFRSIRLQVPRP